jgi:hypothetical protein
LQGTDQRFDAGGQAERTDPVRGVARELDVVTHKDRPQRVVPADVAQLRKGEGGAGVHRARRIRERGRQRLDDARLTEAPEGYGGSLADFGVRVAQRDQERPDRLVVAGGQEAVRCGRSHSGALVRERRSQHGQPLLPDLHQAQNAG